MKPPVRCADKPSAYFCLCHSTRAPRCEPREGSGGCAGSTAGSGFHASRPIALGLEFEAVRYCFCNTEAASNYAAAREHLVSRIEGHPVAAARILREWNLAGAI